MHTFLHSSKADDGTLLDMASQTNPGIQSVSVSKRAANNLGPVVKDDLVALEDGSIAKCCFSGKDGPEWWCMLWSSRTPYSVVARLRLRGVQTHHFHIEVHIYKYIYIYIYIHMSYITYISIYIYIVIHTYTHKCMCGRALQC